MAKEQRAKAIAENTEIQKSCDYDQDNAESVRNFFSAKIGGKYGKDAHVFIPNRFIKNWFLEALPDEVICKKRILPKIKTWVNNGLLPELDTSKTITNGTHGFGWNTKNIQYGDFKSVPIYQEYV